MASNWEMEFQRWSNHKLSNCEYPFGYCGKGVVCDCCSCARYGRPMGGHPCIDAFKRLMHHKPMSIDYSDTSDECFENVWFGQNEIGRYTKLLSAIRDLILDDGFFGDGDKKNFKKVMRRDGFEDLSAYKQYILDHLASLKKEEESQDG